MTEDTNLLRMIRTNSVNGQQHRAMINKEHEDCSIIFRAEAGGGKKKVKKAIKKISVNYEDRPFH